MKQFFVLFFFAFYLNGKIVYGIDRIGDCECALFSKWNAEGGSQTPSVIWPNKNFLCQDPRAQSRCATQCKDLFVKQKTDNNNLACEILENQEDIVLTFAVRICKSQWKLLGESQVAICCTNSKVTKCLPPTTTTTTTEKSADSKHKKSTTEGTSTAKPKQKKKRTTVAPGSTEEE